MYRSSRDIDFSEFDRYLLVLYFLHLIFGRPPCNKPKESERFEAKSIKHVLFPNVKF